MRTLALHLRCLDELEQDARRRRHINAALLTLRFLLGAFSR